MVTVNNFSFSRLALRARRFGRDDDGALMIFGMIFFILMIMFGGFAIDLMRYEHTRTNLQNTLDRSTLAGAALSQRLDPESVVRDYMAKAGLSDQLQSVQVTDGLNSRVVHSTGVADTHPIFLHMLGINQFDAKGGSQAEQSITNVEIVLVLDISGSMTRNNKIGNLKIAATNFVDQILGNDPNHKVSITIVPYNAQVNIGPLLAGKFNLTHPNGVANVNCVELPLSVYDNLPLSQTLPMPMMAYADTAYGTSRINGFVAPTSGNAVPNYSNTFCKPTTVNTIRLPSNDATTLKAEINALQAGGNTSITLGMKWGVTMLDPAMRPAFTDFIASGNIPASMPQRPFNYGEHGGMKIVVLMTDGEHVSHDRIVDAYKTGASPMFLSTGDGNYSVHFTTGRPAVAGTNEYYVPHLNTWQAGPWNSGAGVAQQDWKNIWSNLRLSYVAWQFYGRALGTDTASRNAVYNTTITAMRAVYDTVPDMDATLNSTCTAAKQNGVIIYGIAFEAPTHGQEVIAACASSQYTYFSTRGQEITDAFNSIASNITQLKLTQ